jgi:hypothetical protein
VLARSSAEHVGVDGRVQRTRKGAPKQAEKVALRLRHAALGARDLGRVAREEVEHRLLRRQPRDRRQHAVRVGGQEDDVLRMPARAPPGTKFGMYSSG